jgi:hypothetical protein
MQRIIRFIGDVFWGLHHLGECRRNPLYAITFARNCERDLRLAPLTWSEFWGCVFGR